ncbi:MAG: Asp-tRNA(Asn)/Glu-tRNA(Gln) amidotransferase subunit GatA [Pseudomonadota bacterium]
MSGLAGLSLHQASEGLASGEVTSLELTAACLRAAEEHAALNVVLQSLAESARRDAAASDARRARGEGLGPLDGVPIGLKDNLCTAGVRTTCGSRMLENHVPVYDATVVQRLREAGAVFVGKLNQDEFAFGSSCENSAFGPCHNPWDPARVPGGSSGGSAAAVAAGLCPGSLGSDTGGSIRQPAALCGVTGLKPSYGRVSRLGLVAYASSLDQIGPLGHGALDVAMLLQAIAGHDPGDATSLDEALPDYSAAAREDCRGLRLGVVRSTLDSAGVDPAVAHATREAIEVWRGLGCHIVDVELQHLQHAIACYYLVATAEASSNLARFDGVRYGLRVDPGRGLNALYTETRSQGFGAEAKRRILLGTYALSAGYYDAYYLRAQKVRSLIARDHAAAFSRVDAIVTPTTPTPAFALGEKIADPLTMYLCDVYTVPANLAGLPALSLPSGFCEHPRPLPLGVQLVGRHLDEATLLRLAGAYQRVTDFHARRPQGGA